MANNHIADDRKKVRLINAGDLWSDIMMLPHNGDMISSDEVEQAIKDASAVDAVEVVHGRWKFCDGCGHICSICGFWVALRSLNNYCPNCGAKMDGDGLWQLKSG